MVIKTDLEFISFSDGICDIYSEDDDGNKTYKYNKLSFSNRVLGYNRVFAAKTAQVETNAVICIPQVPRVIDTHDILEITGIAKYDIVLIQNKYKTNPPSIDLTLRKVEMHGVT